MAQCSIKFEDKNCVSCYRKPSGVLSII